MSVWKRAVRGVLPQMEMMNDVTTAYLSFLLELLGEHLERVYGGVELPRRLVPHPIEVLTGQAAAVIPHNDP